MTVWQIHTGHTRKNVIKPFAVLGQAQLLPCKILKEVAKLRKSVEQQVLI